MSSIPDPLTQEDLDALDAHGERFLAAATARAEGIRRKTEPQNLSRRQQDALDAEQAERVNEILGPETVALLDRIDRRREEEARRGFKAMMLAPTLEVCQALLRGERVPWSRLRYWQAKRYGLRRQPTSTRVSLDDFNDIREP